MKRRRLLGLACPYVMQQPDRDYIYAKNRTSQERMKDSIELYITDQISAARLCDTAHRHIIYGGVCLQDMTLVLNSTHHSHNAHARLCLVKQLGTANLTYVETPMYEKKPCARAKVLVPIAGPSESFSEHLLGHCNARNIGIDGCKACLLSALHLFLLQCSGTMQCSRILLKWVSISRGFEDSASSWMRQDSLPMNQLRDIYQPFGYGCSIF